MSRWSMRGWRSTARRRPKARRLLQRLIYAALPTRAAGFETLDHLARKAQRDGDLGGLFLRPAPTLTLRQRRKRLRERLRAPEILRSPFRIVGIGSDASLDTRLCCIGESARLALRDDLHA